MGRWVWAPVVSGPLAGYADRYRSWLAARGYSPRTVSDRLWQLDGLSGWLERERLAAGELSPERVEQFLVARCDAGYTTRWARSMRLPLRFLREIGVVPCVPAPPVAEGPLEELMSDYRRYLARSAGWRRARFTSTTASRGYFFPTASGWTGSRWSA
jgi:hypothetical protein